MPLDREHVTVESRIMLPVYPTLFGLIGFALIFQQPSRTSGPVFDLAASVVPFDHAIQLWGGVFALVALVEIGALLLHRRWMYRKALILAAGVCAFWGVLILGSAFGSDQVSFTGGVWVLLSVPAHIATARSLALDLSKRVNL